MRTFNVTSMEATIIQGRRHRIGMSGSARILGLERIQKHVYFSYLPKERWELKSGPILQEGSRLLRGKRKSQDLGSTLILKGFCKSLSDLERLPIGVVCSLLKGSTKKKKGEYLILRIDY